MDEDYEEVLLFLDTFVHSYYDELNQDLVVFHHPVYLTEVRIIPLGSKVDVNLPGGRMGATLPSSFKVEFFANDLDKEIASAFYPLGSLNYKEKEEIKFPVKDKVSTNCLLLKGRYMAITLAIYGVLINEGSNIESSSSSSLPLPPTEDVEPEKVEDSDSDIEIIEVIGFEKDIGRKKRRHD